ncbi:hypothetical protein EPN96_11310 [bacterium]|nr:MAG: hypothetical protein EPN96_11310 [bacterium]
MDTELEIMKNKIDGLREEMKSTVDRFLATIPGFLSQEYLRLTTSYVEKYPDKTLLLPKETLVEIKREVGALCQKTNEIVQEHIKTKIAWETLDDQNAPSGMARATRQGITGQLRFALGLLGPILEKGGYVSTTPNGDKTEVDCWPHENILTNTGKSRVVVKKISFPLAVTWSKEMDLLYKRMEEIIREFYKLELEKKGVEKRIAEKRASERWKSI